jgi:hypothetical protein
MIIHDIKKLHQINKLAEELIGSAGGNDRQKASRPKKRRSSAEAKEFRAFLKKERERGVPVETLAKKHKITMSYIYQIK